MIPSPGYMPPEAQPQRAMSQADLFVQQTRAQAAAQLSQPAAAFTGGVGGAQPGVMSYAAGRAGAFAGGFGASLQQSAGAAVGGMAQLPAAAAAFATPGVRQFGDIIEGARYQGGGAPPMTLAGMLATGYAPTGMFPHAGMAFGMERGLRREMAQEELGRRTTQMGRGAMHTIAHGATLGLSSYMMRRSGLEASWLTEMETERTLQNRLGVVRGGQFQAATGYGVSREFFQSGPGRDAVRTIQQRGGALQSQFGYGVEQMNMLTRMATGAVDVTRIQQAAAGGQRGMRGLGREISDIRETAAAMAREMQMSEAQIQEFFGRLKGVMKITGEGVRGFQQENRRLSLQGPFSQRQVVEMRMQFTQMGRQMYMGGADFGTEAMQQANRVAELRRSGVISSETLLREGGGLDPQAMARMMAQRLQQQAGLVQAGNFNQSLILASQNPAAYAGMMGGAGYFQTQAAVGGTLARNPFALLQAQLDPDAVRRVTLQAPNIAFQRAQQTPFVYQNEEQLRAQRIRQFGGQIGLNVRTAQGLGQARTRYEELEAQRENIEADLRYLFEDVAGRPAGSKRDIRDMSANLMGIMAETGESSGRLASVMLDISDDVDLQRRWSSSNAVGRTRITREVLAQRDASDVADAMLAGRKTIGEALRSSPARAIRKAIDLGRSMAQKGIANDLVGKAFFGDLDQFSVSSGTMEDLGIMGGGREGALVRLRTGGKHDREIKRQRIVNLGEGRWELQTQTMTTQVNKIRDLIDEKQIKTTEDLQKALASMGGRWHAVEKELITPGTNLGADLYKLWGKQLARGGRDISVESLREAGMARQEWTRARREGAGVFDVMRRAGVDVGSNMVEGIETLLTMDTRKKKAFEKLRADPRMEPMVELAERFGAGGVETREDFTDMTSIVGQSEMRSFFKEYAASKEGEKRLGGQSFQEFLGDAPVKRMNEMFAGMSEGEKQAIIVRSLSSAIEKSQRLVNETKRGDNDGVPLHVKIDSEQVKRIIGIS